jgi:3-methyladenine DNA glycosylase Mpg
MMMADMAEINDSSSKAPALGISRSKMSKNIAAKTKVTIHQGADMNYRFYTLDE